MAAIPLWSPEQQPEQGLGLMRLRPAEPGSPVDPDRKPLALIDAALDAGVTLLDTAEMYGNEELVGRAIAHRRPEVLLCTKFGIRWGSSGRFDDWSVHADPAAVISSCEASLRRLGVETIDLYYLHHRSEETPIEETVSALAGLVESGRIRAIGLSNVTADDVRRAHAVHPVLAVQEEWSLGSRDSEAMFPVLAELGITLVAHSPTQHGRLRGSAGPPVADALAEIGRAHGVATGQVALAWVHERGRPRPCAATGGPDPDRVEDR